MSHGDALRPRRALSSDEPKTDAPDDTPASAPSSPRRGPAAEAAGGQVATPEQADDSDAPEAAGGPSTDASGNPFARPGSRSSMQPAPAATPSSHREAAPEPSPAGAHSADEPASTPIPAPVLPRSSSPIPSPAPRRSAFSSSSPAEIEATQGSWFEAHRSRLLVWAAGGLALALVLALVSFFIARGIRGTEPSPAPSSGSASASPSASPSVPPATVDDLVVPDDLAKISAASGWAEVSTTESAADHKSFAFCLSSMPDGANPVYSFQRTLSTATADKLAALHQIDVYADEASAKTVMDARIAALSNCATQLVPARIVSANSVAGLATRTFEINMVTDDAQADYHTLLLAQVGSSLQLLDVRRIGEAVPADGLAAALVRPQQALNKAEGVEAEVAPVVTPTVVPAVEPLGWLIAPDLPRVRAGAGLWSAQDPQPLGQFGNGCENMTLQSEAGPTERQVASYQLVQDDQAPDLFGLDQSVFTFDDANAAAAFSKKLGDNIAGCKSRLPGSAVTEMKAVASTGVDGAKGSSRLFTVTREQTDKSKKSWQAIVSVTGTRVSYTLVTVDGSYQFTEAQLTAIADRIAVRLTQAG